MTAQGCDDPASPARCTDLENQIAAALAMPGGSCAVDADCAMIGGQLQYPTCDCAPYVVDCSGRPIESNAPGLARARSLIAELVKSGCATASACDCAPRGPLHCGADHRCTAAPQSCLPGADRRGTVTTARPAAG